MDTEILVLPRSRASVVTATTSFRAPDGTAAIPGYSFTNETTSGIRRVSSKVFRWGANTEATFIEIDGNTNGNITLTPNGSGIISVKNGFVATTDNFSLSRSGSTSNGYFLEAAANNGVPYVQAFQTFDIRVYNGSTYAKTLVVDGNGSAGAVLLGGLTTKGVGVLQFLAATTSAGGISFGADLFVYRAATGNAVVSSAVAQIFEVVRSDATDDAVMRVRSSSSTVNFGVFSGAGFVGSQSNMPFAIRTNNTAAITLDTSQNATFAGFVRPVNLSTVSAPTYAKGVIYFDTTLNKLRVGGATAFETITSA
jgi:hypothetical protein